MGWEDKLRLPDRSLVPTEAADEMHQVCIPGDVVYICISSQPRLTELLFLAVVLFRLVNKMTKVRFPFGCNVAGWLCVRVG